MGHVLAEEPHLIKYVIGFALLVATIPFWGDIWNLVSCKKCRKTTKTKPEKKKKKTTKKKQKKKRKR